MARVPYPDPSTQSPEVKDRLKRMGSLNVTRMMSHAEGPMLAYSKLGTALLLRGRLDPVLRELVVLRIGQLCGSAYEWHQHVSVAKAVGMDAATLRAITEQDWARLSPPQRAALTLAEEIKHRGGASEASFRAAHAHFSVEELVELTLVAGYYILTAGFLLSFDIEIEDTPPLGASMAIAAPSEPS